MVDALHIYLSAPPMPRPKLCSCVDNYMYYNAHSLIITQPKECTYCMSFILNHFFYNTFTAPTCFDSISLIMPPCTRNNVHKYRICCHNNIITKNLIFLTRDFSQELYVLLDDDKRYAIETCRSSEKCFKKVI